MEENGERKEARNEVVGADIAGLWSLVLCQPLFPADPPRVAEVQSGKPGAQGRVGNLFYERLSCLLFYRSRPPPPFSPVAHAIASGYRPFLGSVGEKKDETRLNELAPSEKERADYLRGVKGREFWIFGNRTAFREKKVELLFEGRKFTWEGNSPIRVTSLSGEWNGIHVVRFNASVKMKIVCDREILKIRFQLKIFSVVNCLFMKN